MIYGYTKRNKHTIYYTKSHFPGGEINLRINTGVCFPEFDRIEVIPTLSTSDDIMELIMLKNALTIMFKCPIDLKIGYLPYARQDRVCNPGEAFGVDVMVNLIHNMDFHSVTVLDPHNMDSIPNSWSIRTQHDMLVQSHDLYNEIISGKITLVAPDVGATAKTADISKDFIQGHKLRDSRTGKLSGFNYIGNVKDKDLLIVDDICDGGGTFIGLASKLYEGGARSVSLYVTHGIFSKGTEILYKNDIKNIYTTDSLDNNVDNKIYWS